MIMDEENHPSLNMIYAVIFQRRKIQNAFCCFISGMYNWSTLKERDISKTFKNFLILLKGK